MWVFEFPGLSFRRDPEGLLVLLYEQFYFKIHLDELKEFGEFKIQDNKIIFKSKRNLKMKFLNLVLNKLRKEMINSYTNRKIVYVDSDFMYLLGNRYFGFIDKGTNVVEVRPITGCINKCIFCSVSEGPGIDFWQRDFYVPSVYLTNYAREISKLKGKENLEFLINPQGEIMLYPELPDLVQGLKEYGERVGIITALWPLNEKLVLDTINAGLDFISVSLHSLNPKLSKVLMGNPEYDVQKILEFLEQINEKVDITLTPVLIKKYNLSDFENLIKFAKEKIRNKFRPIIVPQKYLVHKHGRKIKGEKFDWKEFYGYLDYWEKKYNIKLKFSNEEFRMERRKEIPAPFKVGEIVKVEIASEGRLKNEYLVNAKERTFAVYSRYPEFKKVRIVQAKHNIVIGKAI